MSGIPLKTVPTSYLFTAVALMLIAIALIGKYLIVPHNSLPSRGSSPLAMNFTDKPILQLELARNENDIRRILLPEENPAGWKDNVSDTRAGNRADSYLFIPCYTVLLAIGSLLALRGHPSAPGGAFWIFLIATLAVSACDYGENAGIGRTLNHIGSDATGSPQHGDAAAIGNFGRAKWILLTLVLAALAIVAATSGLFSVKVFSLLPLIAAGGIANFLVRYFVEWRSLP